MAKKRSRTPEVEGISTGRILVGGAGGFFFLLCAVFLASVLFHMEKLPWESGQIAGILITGLSALISSFLSARKNGKKLFSGCLGALWMFILLIFTGILLFDGKFQPDRLLISGACTAAGAMGGVLLAGLLSH